MRVRGVLFYPLAVATLPVVYLYAQNPGESITVTDFLFPLAVVLAGTLAAILFLRLFIRDNAKVAVIVSILLAVFFSLGHINQWMLENDISWNGMLLARYLFLLPASTGIASYNPPDPTTLSPGCPIPCATSTHHVSLT